jgi:hypothetical protein
VPPAALHTTLHCQHTALQTLDTGWIIDTADVPRNKPTTTVRITFRPPGHAMAAVFYFLLLTNLLIGWITNFSAMQHTVGLDARQQKSN